MVCSYTYFITFSLQARSTDIGEGQSPFSPFLVGYDQSVA